MTATLGLFETTAARVSLVRSTPGPAANDGPPQGIVHLMESDDDARRTLSTIFLSAGLETRICTDPSAFPGSDVSARQGCLVVNARLLLAEDCGLQARLHALDEAPALVVTAAHADVGAAVGAMKAGALDVLEKPFHEAAVLAAVQAAIMVDGERRAAHAARATVKARFATLTPRERQVMALVTAGKMNKQVAGDLGLSEITVKAHRGAVMRKMGARSLAQLVRMADAMPAVH